MSEAVHFESVRTIGMRDDIDVFRIQGANPA